jgi:hypothetical protein
MQQRRLRLGDIVDDYCPRERRVTNHAIVAMVEDDVKQTRCTTCDTEHEFKHGRMPTLRRKKDPVSVAYQEVLAAVTSDPSAAAPHVVAPPREEAPAMALAGAPAPTPEQAPESVAEPVQGQGGAPGDDAGDVPDADQSEAGRVHRRLIRATLPRLENQPVVRPIPEFTMHQPPPRPGKFRGGMARGMGSRPGGVGRGGHAVANPRGPVFGRPANSRGGVGQSGRPAGRNEIQRHARGQQQLRHPKKHSK